uniref:inovirus Gp2 family protein n=1 Tax=Marinobacterium profundum TaxID=1714300 RepID=UPI00082D4D9D|nr:inovirus Gp2 family protein [Marinobacterium profundum]
MYQKRVPGNHNLTFWNESDYRGWPVYNGGLLVKEYLDRLLYVIDNATQDFTRVFAVRVDLRCAGPTGDIISSNEVIDRFKKSLDSRLDSYQKRRARQGKRVCRSAVRMVWARELKDSRTPHYHLLLLFNREQFHRLGEYHSVSGSLMTMIRDAWYSALGLSLHLAPGLVYIPENAEYHLNRSDHYAQLPALFFRASYLCKVDTKCFGQGLQNFGGTRK